jgi:hypothetical protein
MMKRPPFTTVGAAGVAAGCAAMVAMLPGAAAGALGALGIASSGSLARTLSPVAEPLFVGSSVLVIVGALTCGRLVAILSVAGSVLLYLSMFQLAAGGSSSGGSMSMMSMSDHRQAALQAEPVSFYLGLALLLTAFGFSFWRRRRHDCRAVVRLPLRLAARRTC